MPRYLSERRRPTNDLSTVESQRNDLTAEEFPEGPYGASIDSPSLGKSEPWRADQHAQVAFDYENKELHEGMSRGYPGDDPLPDDSAGTTD
ncbi:hypothetical protein [Cohnella sp. REN36]|uniref:hypothetical protein n=1 Tax=Cohnella sp. REN36 TaxID=2887347 RepID=UPI001D15A48B|nr:hypothetical protein [Cohnella sp. REN36]MCC3377095.1 hypothetical protein [Cohnella sp. REN36]